MRRLRVRIFARHWFVPHLLEADIPALIEEQENLLPPKEYVSILNSLVRKKVCEPTLQPDPFWRRVFIGDKTQVTLELPSELITRVVRETQHSGLSSGDIITWLVATRLRTREKCTPSPDPAGR